VWAGYCYKRVIDTVVSILLCPCLHTSIWFQSLFYIYFPTLSHTFAPVSLSIVEAGCSLLFEYTLESHVSDMIHAITKASLILRPDNWTLHWPEVARSTWTLGFYIAVMLFDSGGDSCILEPSLMAKTAAKGRVFTASEARFGLSEMSPSDHVKLCFSQHWSGSMLSYWSVGWLS
jgi:hypothetical protein